MNRTKLTNILVFPSRETMIDHLEIESSIISRNSNEGKRQLERELEKGEGRLQESSWGENKKSFDCLDNKRMLKMKQKRVEEDEIETVEEKKNSRVFNLVRVSILRTDT